MAALKCNQCGSRVEAGKRWLRHSAIEDGKRIYDLNFCSKACADLYELSHPRHAQTSN